jgi:hypothetical protein
MKKSADDADKFPAHIGHVMATRKKIPWKKIHALRGSLKRQPGDKSFAEEWAEHKREEKELEDAKFARCTRSARPCRCSNRAKDNSPAQRPGFTSHKIIPPPLAERGEGRGEESKSV